MSPAETFSAEFHSGFRATLTVSLKGIRCEWSPDLPRNLDSTTREALLAAYRSWRDDCLAQFARAHHLTMRTFRAGDLDAIAFSKAQDST